MKLTRVPLGIIYLDSIRSRAYLNAFIRRGICPQEVILMDDSFRISDRFSREAEKYDYGNQYFDFTIDPHDFFQSNGIQVNKVSSKQINDPGIVERLKNSGAGDFLFTGGGIVPKSVLSAGKRLLHIHPGKIPDYRGSTCFYYSILEGNGLGATAFFMHEKLDSGPIIAQRSFSFNLRLRDDQPLFIDSVLDPYIRMKTLEEALACHTDSKRTPTIQKEPYRTDKEAYYVMHPVLRNLTFSKINRSYDPSRAEGVIEREESN